MHARCSPFRSRTKAMKREDLVHSHIANVHIKARMKVFGLHITEQSGTSALAKEAMFFESVDNRRVCVRSFSPRCNDFFYAVVCDSGNDTLL